MGSKNASTLMDTVRQSNRMMIFFRGNLSASLPPSSATGRETSPAVAISSVAVPSLNPSLVVSRKVSMGHTKEPMAVTSCPTKRM